MESMNSVKKVLAAFFSTRTRAKSLVVLGVASLFVFASLASATMIVPRTYEELAFDADAVIVGKVVDSEAAYDRHGRIVTDSRIIVEDVVRGKSDKEIIMRSLGGEVGEIGMRVSGEVMPPKGYRGLFFLRGYEHVFRPVGMSQGVMEIRGEKNVETVNPAAVGLAFVDRNGHSVVDLKAGADAKSETKSQKNNWLKSVPQEPRSLREVITTLRALKK